MNPTRLIACLLLTCSLFAAESLNDMANEDYNGRLAQETALRRKYQRGDQETQQKVLKALSQSQHPAALPFAIKLTENDKDPTKLAGVLNQIVNSPATAAALNEVRELANSREPVIRRAAIKSLGTLDDDLSLDLLIEQATSTDKATAKEAETALQAITGLNHTSTTAWNDWHTKETEKLEMVLPTLTRQLESKQPQEVLAAVHQLLQMDQHTGLAMDMLEPLLLHDDPSIAGLVQEGFQRIGGNRATAILQLYDSEELADAAHNPNLGPEQTLNKQIAARINKDAPPPPEPEQSNLLTIIFLVLLIGATVVIWLRLRKQKPKHAGRR